MSAAASDRLRRILVGDVPLMDVRAPVEFGKGAVPGAINLPLMNDAERQQVGTCYKERGQAAAIALGHQLVSGRTRSERIAAWAGFAAAHPDGMLYCARGGLRSQIAQQWIAEAGIDFPRVPGGYKALRGFLLEATAQTASEGAFVLLSGLTGSGKTELLQQLPHGLDLEGHARHRGSSFGARLDAQPSQSDFENALAIDLLKKHGAGVRRWVVEDEGRHIGACGVPLVLRQRMERAPVVWLDEAFELRVERILRDYVLELQAQCVQRWGQDVGFARFADRLRGSLARMQNRLGGARYQRLGALLEAALASRADPVQASLHRPWIADLLQAYYDPMYRFQQERLADRIVFRGDRAAVLGHLGCAGPSGTARGG